MITHTQIPVKIVIIFIFIVIIIIHINFFILIVLLLFYQFVSALPADASKAGKIKSSYSQIDWKR